jgi:2-phospho-L-lactate transferase/gluconeogenesis factor (CofD/UPF0052 family)
VRVVAIGGGTGLSMLLHGLKHFVARRRQEADRHPISDLAAIVTVTDDGGSSGACGASTAFCRPATFATAWWRSRRTKRCWGACFSTVFMRAADCAGTALETCF